MSLLKNIKTYEQAKRDKKKSLENLKEINRVLSKGGEKAQAAANRNGLVQRLEAKIAACDLTMKTLKQSNLGLKLMFWK